MFSGVTLTFSGNSYGAISFLYWGGKQILIYTSQCKIQSSAGHHIAQCKHCFELQWFLHPYFTFFYLLYPKLMDYYQFLCILKLALIDIGFEQRSHHGSLFVICHKDHTKPDAVSILPWQDITATFSPGISAGATVCCTRTMSWQLFSACGRS